MIGTGQRLITLGRLDITIAMFKLISYRVAPQKRHLEQMKRLYGYIKQFPMLLYIFVHTYLSKVKWYMSPMNEELHLDMPITLGKFVQTSLFFDTNLYHDLVMGHAMTGIIHLVNQHLC